MTQVTTRRLRLVDPDDPGTRAAPQGGHMRIAIATQDMTTADAHFASAKHLAIYDVSPEGYRFIEAIGFDGGSDQSGQHSTDDHDDRIGPRIAALQGCVLLFVRAIGGPAAAKVVARKIHPIKLQKDEAISQVLDRVRTMLAGSPPPWLRKALREGLQPKLELSELEEPA